MRVLELLARLRVPELVEVFRPVELGFLLREPVLDLLDEFLAEEEPRVAMIPT
ncbi:MAG: hypothetical protein Q4D79_04535 [Propionibacteriaceae bacterium]|nr:hypothetical protein [Propionibacteriaceae bacterium]